MGLLDDSDMQISFSECVRKMINRYKKWFFQLLDLSMLNAYILYKEKKQVTLEFTNFRLQVIRKIFYKYGAQRGPRKGRLCANKPLRLMARHFPSLINGGLRQCIVCSTTAKRQKKRSRIRYECAACGIGVCIAYCF